MKTGAWLMASATATLIAVSGGPLSAQEIRGPDEPAPETHMPSVTPSAVDPLAPETHMPSVTPAAAKAETPAVTNRPANSAAGAVPENQPEELTAPGITLTPSHESTNLISITLDDVPLQDVVRMFTRISGANILATATNLQGKVTVNLQDVDWKAALSSILEMQNLALTERPLGSGIYSITAKPPGQPEPPAAETLFLSYTSVTNVLPTVERLLEPGGSVTPFSAGNALIISASPANILRIRKVIKDEIDLPRNQVYIEAKFVELTDSAIKDLGVNWSVLQGYSIGASGLGASLNDSRTTAKSRTSSQSDSESLSHVDSVKETYDANGKQLTVTDPSRTANDSITKGKETKLDLANSVTRNLTDIRTAVLSADDFTVILSALKQMQGVAVVSNPKIIVANEARALIDIGQKEPNIKGTVTAGQQGQANTTTYSLDDREPYFTYGITVEVIPTINTSSNITVRIKPILSRFISNKTAPDGNTYPIRATKTVETVFSLESGKTAAIGGLTETTERDTGNSIPLLSSIPVVGKYLFGNSHKEKVQDETIIFVTVGLANPELIDRNLGLPEDAELIHRHLLQREVSRRDSAVKLKQLKAATEAELKKSKP